MEIFSIIILFVVLIFSAILHEIAHGWMAYLLGDPTAKNAGRLTLNPKKHIDPIGTIFLPLILLGLSMLSGGGGFIFGWARPVPINPFNFKDKRYGTAKVAAAGPLSNILLALLFGLALRFGYKILPQPTVFLFLFVVQVNLLLAFFNLLPIPPLDGSHILFTFVPLDQKTRFFLLQYGIFILLFFLLFFGPHLISLINILVGYLVGHHLLSIFI